MLVLLVTLFALEMEKRWHKMKIAIISHCSVGGVSSTWYAFGAGSMLCNARNRAARAQIMILLDLLRARVARRRLVPSRDFAARIPSRYTGRIVSGWPGPIPLDFENPLARPDPTRKISNNS